jgi:hypothetical protein
MYSERKILAKIRSLENVVIMARIYKDRVVEETFLREIGNLYKLLSIRKLGKMLGLLRD